MNPEISYASQGANTAPEPKPQGFFSRLIGVYFSPGETFQEIGRAPRLFLPIIALAVFSLAASFAVTTKMPFEAIMDQRVQQQIDSGKTSPEQGELAKEQMRKFVPIMKWTTPFSITIYVIVLALIFAGLARLASMILGVDNNFKSLLSVSVYSILAVSIISSILFIVLIYIKPLDEFDWENPISSNLATLLSLNGTSGQARFLKTLTSYIDVFFIWRLILLALGFAAVSKKLKTSTALTWLVAVSLLIALCHSAFMAR
jgi:preprotein translocase subunit SecG